MSGNMRDDRRGQVSSVELLLAYFVFFIVFTLVVSMWVGTLKEVNSGERERDFEDAASRMSEKLVKTRGLPADWTAETVTAVGLADEPRILNTQKVLGFINLTNDSASGDCGYSEYECNKELLGIGKYDFNFSIEDLDGAVVELDGVNLASGRTPIDETDRLTVIRSAMLGDQIVRLRLTFWYEEKGEA
jgi:hypothetical protein